MAVIFPTYRRFKSQDATLTKTQDYIQELVGRLKSAETLFNRYSPAELPSVSVAGSGILTVALSSESRLEAFRSQSRPSEWILECGLALSVTYSTVPTNITLVLSDIVQIAGLYQPLAALWYDNAAVLHSCSVSVPPLSPTNAGYLVSVDAPSGGGAGTGVLYVAGQIRLKQKPAWVPVEA